MKQPFSINPATRAHKIVQRAVERGRLPNLKTDFVKCTDCLERATQYDHRDYSKPLVVDPVCQHCNLKRGAAEVSRVTCTQCGKRSGIYIRIRTMQAVCRNCGNIWDVTQYLDTGFPDVMVPRKLPLTPASSQPRCVMTDTATEIRFWQDAADRRERAGETATAICFRNLAWLLEHRASWLDTTRKEGAQCQAPSGSTAHST